jgi:hypothetical protein
MHDVTPRLVRAAQLLQVDSLQLCPVRSRWATGRVHDASRHVSEVVLVALEDVDAVAEVAERVRSSGDSGLVLRGGFSGVLAVVCATDAARSHLARLVGARSPRLPSDSGAGTFLAQQHGDG